MKSQTDEQQRTQHQNWSRARSHARARLNPAIGPFRRGTALRDSKPIPRRNLARSHSAPRHLRADFKSDPFIIASTGNATAHNLSVMANALYLRGGGGGGSLGDRFVWTLSWLSVCLSALTVINLLSRVHTQKHKYTHTVCNILFRVGSPFPKIYGAPNQGAMSARGILRLF